MTRKTITYGTKSKEQAQTNKNDSYYKLVMDAWYKSIFKDSIYEQYLADNIFCNDRTIDSDTFDGAYKNLGYGQEDTLYRFGGSYYRGMQKLMQDYMDDYGNNPLLAIVYFYATLYKVTMDNVSTSLICSQKNDSFTVSDSLYGNANLTYPIGELTADDVMTAGGYFGKINENYFLHTGNAMGLITPINYPFTLSLSFSNSAYSPKSSRMLFTALANNGTLMGNNGGFIMSNPVINLKNGTLNSGTGSREDPYIISDAAETTKVKKEYYLNNKKVDVIPQTYEKNRYSIDKIECDNGTTGTWNTDKWTLETSDVTTTSTCKIYFTYEQKLKTKYYVEEKGSNITAESAKVGNYTVDRVTCNNGVTGTWNNDKWELEVTNFYIDATCNVYLKAPTISIANNKIEVDSYGICPNTKLDGNTTINEVETNKGYVCGALDTYGVSYYYRGNVTNNYVKFGKWADNTPDVVIGYYSDSSSNYKEYSSMSECNNASQYKTNCTTVSRAGKDMYWRILRINGDGTIRMMYDGTSAHNNEDKSIDREIGKSQFNSAYGDNAYIGYMYGTVGSSTYAATHTNTNNSTIKTYLDNWYKNNIVGTSNEQYITDKVFCNDRSFSSDNTGTGAGTNSTEYRWYSSSSKSGSLLTCPQQNDAFTVSDTSTGNGKLTYPIGLITADEASLAGAYGTWGLVLDKRNYLNSSQNYWTMTPSSYNFTNLVKEDGYWFTTYNQTYSEGVRPVLNLKADALNAGTGTASDPYRIS